MIPHSHLRVMLFMIAVITAACDPPPSEEPATTASPSAVATYEPIPPGYDYLADTAALQRAVANTDVKAMRRHGWLLWAGAMQQARSLPGWAVWGTWPNSFGAFSEEQITACATESTQLGATSSARVHRNLLQANLPLRAGTSFKLPYYPVPEPVIAAYPRALYPGKDGPQVCDGPTFVSNGDIMIPTEAMSGEAFAWIRENRLYLKSELDTLLARGANLEGPATQITTKHMFWPVLKEGVSAIPVWHDDFGPEFKGYAGYETWRSMVGVDPSGKTVGTRQSLTYLHGVFTDTSKKTRIGPRTGSALVYPLDNFYHHEVTTADWARFSDADKAILNAASYWAYDKPFGVGDFLVTVAMHINTREVPSWATQSVWWSDQPATGPYAADRPDMPAGTQGPWSHYLLTTSFAQPASGSYPVQMNPYIELAVHPVATNCHECHRGASWVRSENDSSSITTDFQWSIPDRAR